MIYKKPLKFRRERCNSHSLRALASFIKFLSPRTWAGIKRSSVNPFKNRRRRHSGAESDTVHLCWSNESHFCQAESVLSPRINGGDEMNKSKIKDKFFLLALLLVCRGGFKKSFDWWKCGFREWLGDWFFFGVVEGEQTTELFKNWNHTWFYWSISSCLAFLFILCVEVYN